MERTEAVEAEETDALGWPEVRAAVGRFWWLILLLVIAAVTAASVRVFTTDDLFRSESTVVFSPTAGLEPYNSIEAVRALERRAMQATFSEIAEGGSVLDDALERSGIEEPARLDYVVDTAIAQEANIVEVGVTGSDRGDVAAVTAAVVDDTIERFVTLYPIYEISVLSGASDPLPVDDTLVTDLVLAVGAALLLGAGLAVVLHRVAPRRHDARSSATGDTLSDPS
jgi:capsular polysaccharide biosynthesis protein